MGRWIKIGLATLLMSTVVAIAPSAADAAPDAADGAAAADGAVAVDSTGRAQPLLAAYRTAALRRALAAIGEPHGQPMRRLLDTLDLARLEVGSAAEDIDTPGDLARWQEGRP